MAHVISKYPSSSWHADNLQCIFFFLNNINHIINGEKNTLNNINPLYLIEKHSNFCKPINLVYKLCLLFWLGKATDVTSNKWKFYKISIVNKKKKLENTAGDTRWRTIENIAILEFYKVFSSDSGIKLWVRYRE